MPFPMKIQPIDFHTLPDEPVKPVARSRFKRLFERQFTSVLRISAAEKTGGEESHLNKEVNNGSGEFEPSSVCLGKMVQNFIEGSNEKSLAAAKCGRNRCNCFNRGSNDNSEDELDLFGGFGDSNFANSSEACEILKGLVLCASVWERNLLADTARIVERSKICKLKDEICRTIVTDGLLALGYDASICKSRWEKSPSYPAGEYEYIDVIVEGERLIIDIDFRSEFEIARPTKTYKTILQTLPLIFVGKSDRLQKIIGVVSEAAKQSLKKRGFHVPPWRKADYVKSKWLSPHTRDNSPLAPVTSTATAKGFRNGEKEPSRGNRDDSVDDTELGGSIFSMSCESGEEEKPAVLKDRKPAFPKQSHVGFGVGIGTGLASVMNNEP